MSNINGRPHPDGEAWSRPPGGGRGPTSNPYRHAGGRSCAGTLAAILAMPWLLDLLLAGSQAVA